MQEFRPDRHRVNMFSTDGGHTYATIGLGSLMTREDVDKAAIGAAETIGIGLEDFSILGSTVCNGAGEVTLGVVGVNFRAPLMVDAAVVFALSLTAGKGDVALNLGRVGEVESLTPIPLLNP